MMMMTTINNIRNRARRYGKINKLNNGKARRQRKSKIPCQSVTSFSASCVFFGESSRLPMDLERRG